MDGGLAHGKYATANYFERTVDSEVEMERDVWYGCDITRYWREQT